MPEVIVKKVGKHWIWQVVGRNGKRLCWSHGYRDLNDCKAGYLLARKIMGPRVKYLETR